MITKITVDGFKSLAGFEIELGQVNVLIGANGSGKTNVLEAIGVLSAAARGRLDDEALHRRGVRLSAPGRYQTRLTEIATRPTVGLAAEWSGEDGDAGYEVQLEPAADTGAWRYIQERATYQGRVTLDRDAASNGALSADAGWVALKRVELAPDSGLGQLVTWLQEYAVWSADTPTLRGTREDLQQRAPLGLRGGGLAEAVDMLESLSHGRGVPDDGYYADVLANAVGLVDWALRLGVDERSGSLIARGVPSGQLVLYFVDRFMAGEWAKLAGYECSEGAIYVLAAAVLAAGVPAPWLLAMDDFDHALNPRLARALVEHFCGWVIDNPVPRQVLITTQNPLILDGLDLTDDRIRLFAVERTSKGRTWAQRVEVDEALLKYAEEGWPLSRLWVMGEIGGVPAV